MAHSGDASATLVIWVTVALKTGGALLALSLVRPWGAALPRRLRAGVAGAAALVLTLYGGLNMVGEALVELHVVTPSTPVDWTGLAWHLALWDAWFLAWGLLLGAATWRFLRPPGDIVLRAPTPEGDRAKTLA